MVAEAQITGHIITWARERAHLPQDVVAKRLNVKQSKLDAWERGDEKPTFKQAINIADKLKVPLGYLYLDEPLVETLPIPDFRTATGAQPLIPSKELLDVVYDAQRKQAWYREYLEANGVTPLEFVGRYELAASPLDVSSLAVSEDIQATLGLDNEMRREAGNWEEFLVEFVRRAEEAGIIVLRAGIVGSNTKRTLSVDEFRGFAIVDSIAPLILVNSRDSKSAQNFTIAHELAHIWMANGTGVSNPNYRRKSADQPNELERLCNRIAADTLVPPGDFLDHWDERLSIEDRLRDLTRRYKVSTLVVLRQALDLDKLGEDEYWDLVQGYRNGHAQQSRKGGEFYNPFFARNSRMFVTMVIGAVREGRLSHIDAGTLLNIKGQSLKGVTSKLA